MMLVDLISYVSTLELSSWHDLQSLFHHWDWDVMAAGTQFDTDVFAGTRNWFNNFMKTGQVWALMIGIALGFMIRSLTSYG
jgi:hypothetical protein